MPRRSPAAQSEKLFPNSGTTALGIGSLSGANSPGRFFLNTWPLSLTGGIFQLNITFTAPTGILGGQNATYVATVVGTISPNIDQGGVNVDFLNPTQTALTPAVFH